MTRKNTHVVPREDGWAVRREGNERDTARTDTQREAIEIAREIERRNGGEVVIHRENGQIRDRDSYGNDQNPPKDKKH